MGEVIYSICIGGFLVIAGIAMNVVLRREEKKLGLKEKNEKIS